MTSVAPARAVSIHHLFPRFHVRPPRGYVNDPNGPVVLDGVTHLYFQYRDTTDLNAPVLWGHASSLDLARWTLHEPAAVPHPGLPDQDGCWSGNTVVDDQGQLRSFYSGLRRNHPYQSVLSAVSPDQGASFSAPVQVLKDPDPHEQIVTFRDPFVWRDGRTWSMVVGAGDSAGTASVRHYKSTDLNHWHHAGDLARSRRRQEGAIDTGEMWECPQVLHLDGQPYLLVGAWTHVDGTMRVYVIPRGPAGGPVSNVTVTALDAGPDFYAASVLRDSPHGPVIWGWIREARDHSWCEEDGWSGAISLPRVAEALPSGAIAQRPHPALKRLRPSTGLNVGPSGATGLPAQLELEASIGSGQTHIRLIFSDQEHLDITADADTGTVTVDRSVASSDTRAAGGVCAISGAFDPSTPAQIRAYLDGSILELFTSSGQVATIRFYPTTPPPYRLETTSTSRVDVTLWDLSSHDGRA